MFSRHVFWISFDIPSKVDVLLDEEKLKDEIKYLERKIKLMKDYNGFHQSMPLKAVEDEAFENNLYNKSEKLGLLLKWCCLVGKLHGVKVIYQAY